MKLLRDLESLGWIFWLVLAIILAPGSIWLAYQATYNTASAVTRVGAGLFTAAIGSSLITWLLNEVIYRFRMRQEQRKKKAGKKKRKAKGK